MVRHAFLLVAALAVLAPEAAGAGGAHPVAAAAVAGPRAAVAARPAKVKRKPKPRHRPGKAKRKARRGARASTGGRGHRGHAAAAPARNMPAGWSWPPNPAMVAAGQACTARLDELGVVWRPAAAQKQIATPITVPSMTFGGIKVVPTFRPPPFVMDCHLALALTTFSKDLYELGIRELKFSRIYGYTKVRTEGVIKNVLSRHALGLAIDVRAVVDADGREAVVVRDYRNDDPLLLRLEDFLNDAGGFRTVLTPRNDPKSHDDHFHVEVALTYGS